MEADLLTALCHGTTLSASPPIREAEVPDIQITGQVKGLVAGETGGPRGPPSGRAVKDGKVLSDRRELPGRSHGVSADSGGAAPPPRARVAEPGDLPAALKALGITAGRPVLVLVGGAGGMSAGQMTALAGVIGTIVPALGDWGAAVVDGGTDSGVMR